MFRPLVLAAALCALALPAAAAAAPQADAILSSIAGVQVQCWTAAEWSAFTASTGHGGAKGIFDVDARTVSLVMGECGLLRALGRGYRPHAQLRTYAVAEAVFVLAHELAHGAGIDDETLADCSADRSFAAVAVRLGASAAYARELECYEEGSVSFRLAGRCP